MTLKTKVLAVRDGEEREIATGLTKAEAADLIERGVWPRGYEAVFEAENGKRWLLAP